MTTYYINPEKILEKWYKPLNELGDIARLELLYAMKEYGEQIKEATLDWAAENAHIEYDADNNPEEGVTATVDKESILRGKESIVFK